MSKQDNTNALYTEEELSQADGLRILEELYVEEYAKRATSEGEDNIIALRGKALLNAFYPTAIKKPEPVEAIAKRLYNEIKDKEALRLLYSIELRDKLHSTAYRRWRSLLDRGAPWVELLSLCYEKPVLSEVFVTLVEESTGEEVRSPHQFKKLTGIEAIVGYWDEDKQEVVPYSRKHLNPREAKREATRQLSAILYEALRYRYVRALEFILDSGGKYEALLAADYTKAKLTQAQAQSLIEQVIGKKYELEAHEYRPDLRAIAEKLEAPYSVIQRAYQRNKPNAGIHND